MADIAPRFSLLSWPVAAGGGDPRQPSAGSETEAGDPALPETSAAWHSESLSSLVEAFIERSAALTREQWDLIIDRASETGKATEAVDLVRGAAIALALRNLLTPDQFGALYGPFLDVIPVESLPPGTD